MKILEKIIEYGLYIFVFLLPWQTRLIFGEGNLNGYWEYGTISIYATEILLWLIFLLTAGWWAIEKFKTQNSKLKTPTQNSKLFYLIIFFFLFYSLVSVLWAGSRGVALQAYMRLAEGVGLFLVLRIAKFNMIKLAWVFVASAVIQAGLGVWQFLSQSTFVCKWLGMAYHDPVLPGTYVVETALRRWLRAYGGLPHPNMLAGFLAAAMFFSFWLYRKTEYGLKKLLLPVIFSVLSLGLLATFSKSVIGSFLAILFTGWTVVLIRRQSWEIKIDLLKFTLAFLVIVGVFGAVFWEPVSTRIYSQDRLEIKSISERLSYFGEAWQLVKNHPVFGVGIGNYTLAVHDEINPDLKSWDYQPVHNIYLLILAELGIVGFLLWLSLIIILIRNLPLTRYPLLVAILAIGLLDHYLWTLYFGIILFWLVLGVVSLKEKALCPLDNRLDRQ